MSFVGADGIRLVMPHIEGLFTSEDSSVRDQMMTTMTEFITQITEDQLFGLAQRLFKSNIFSANISAVMLFCRLSKRTISLTADISHTRLKDILENIKISSRSKIP